MASQTNNESAEAINGIANDTNPGQDLGKIGELLTTYEQRTVDKTDKHDTLKKLTERYEHAKAGAEMFSMTVNAAVQAYQDAEQRGDFERGDFRNDISEATIEACFQQGMHLKEVIRQLLEDVEKELSEL